MKIIDLLNKISNGEEVPKFIKYDTKVMEYSTGKQDYLGYYSNGNGNWLFQYLFDKCRNTKHFINDEVEILEEEKKIPEKLEDRAGFQYSEIPTWLEKKEIIRVINGNFEKQQKAIYEIIDYLKSKEKGE